ncbi:MAG: GHKL domain-containing protein [Epsilonproteobacteria bacterium]|nr:GHKL domain-containing protein [Campylobacterota bacterium]
MKQWSYLYENKEGFEAFATRYRLDLYENLLIQVNCGIADVEKIDALRKELVDTLPNALIAGSTSAKQLHDMRFADNKVVLAITAFEKSRLDMYEYRCPRNERYDYREILDRLGAGIGADTKGILLFANTVHFNMEGFVKEFNKDFSHIPLFGGIASSPEALESYIVFSKNEVYVEEGIVAIVMHGENLQISCNYFFNWEPIGREFTVTKANGRYLYALDGKLIIDVYENYFGKLSREKLMELALAHPLIRKSKEFGTVARALLEPASDGGFYSGEFVEGEKVQIGFGHYKKMLAQHDTIPEVYQELPVESLWFYICISYQYGYLDILEASAGFFEEKDKLFAMMTFGEFCHHDGKNKFLNYALTRVALSETPDARIRIKPIRFQCGQKDELLATLSTLVSSSSREIMDLNRYLEKEVAKRTRELAELNEQLEMRIAQEVRKNREKDKMLYHQSKLAAMGEMINNIAHQWRQPLNIIALVMQDLSLKAQMGTLSIKEIREAEQKINETLKYLSDTIDDFRSFASQGLDYSHPGALDVCKTVSDTVRLVSVVLEDEKIGIKMSLPSDPIWVAGSPNDLKQVLLNLIYNAIDIFKERRIKEPLIKIEVKENGRRAIVTVRDNGGGISEKIIDKIFEPYFTTKYQARGTGLGLYMSKLIVEKRLHGEIHARNTRSGAAFWIDLPVTA